MQLFEPLLVTFAFDEVQLEGDVLAQLRGAGPAEPVDDAISVTGGGVYRMQHVGELEALAADLGFDTVDDERPVTQGDEHHRERVELFVRVDDLHVGGAAPAGAQQLEGLGGQFSQAARIYRVQQFGAGFLEQQLAELFQQRVVRDGLKPHGQVLWEGGHGHSLLDAVPAGHSGTGTVHGGPLSYRHYTARRGAFCRHRGALAGRLYSLAMLFLDRKSTRLNSSHVASSYAVFCLKKKNNA